MFQVNLSSHTGAPNAAAGPARSRVMNGALGEAWPGGTAPQAQKPEPCWLHGSDGRSSASPTPQLRLPYAKPWCCGSRQQSRRTFPAVYFLYTSTCGEKTVLFLWRGHTARWDGKLSEGGSDGGWIGRACASAWPVWPSASGTEGKCCTCSRQHLLAGQLCHLRAHSLTAAGVRTSSARSPSSRPHKQCFLHAVTAHNSLRGKLTGDSCSQIDNHREHLYTSSPVRQNVAS